jgi:HD-GYP domain-containing protein (c-di-GMP phosphodiesterase class II)
LIKLRIQSVQPGNKVAKSIYTPNGNVLIGAGLELTERYIERLINLGIDTVYIDDPNTLDIIPDDLIRDETRKKAVEVIFKTMSTLMDQPFTRGRTSIPNLGSTFRSVFRDILGDLTMRKDILVNLANLHSLDGYFFHHSVNVAVLAGILGLAKGYNQNQLLDLGVGSLLFDIGMTQLPKELWNKSGPISNEERKRIQYHAEDGFNILRHQYDISLLSAHCAFQHHERYNGLGYPRKLQGEGMHEYAQIVAIADVYDALTSPRNFRDRHSPTEATEFLFAAGNNFFDIELVKLFLRHIAVYPIASTVQLNTGQIGVVSSIDPVAVHRPVIRIIQETPGISIASPYEIDLKSQFNLVIKRTL